MNWKFRLKSKKNSTGFTITCNVVKSPKPGVYSDWDSPHKEWNIAKQHALEKMTSQHSDGDSYEVDGIEFKDPNSAIDALKMPK